MAVTTTTVISNGVRALYNAAAMEALYQKAQFHGSAISKAVELGEGGIGKGKSAVFDLLTAGTISTAALSETGDGTAVSLAMTQVEITPAEYGNFVQTTKKLSLTSYSDVEEHAAMRMGQMSAETLDKLARGALDTQTGATWVDYAGSATAVNTITIGDELTAADVRKAFATLKARNVEPFEDGYYRCFIHPHVLKDLKDETGNDSWTVKELYTGERILPIRDEVGAFEGFRFIMSTNVNLQSKGGNGTTTSAASADVYSTYFLGDEALGFAHVGDVPTIEVTPPVGGTGDAFKRYTMLAWYALCSYSALRADALFKVYSCSSLAANGA